jgi:hypothetical protein
MTINLHQNMLIVLNHSCLTQLLMPTVLGTQLKGTKVKLHHRYDIQFGLPPPPANPPLKMRHRTHPLCHGPPASAHNQALLTRTCIKHWLHYNTAIACDV